MLCSRRAAARAPRSRSTAPRAASGELTARDLLSCPVVPLCGAFRRLLAGGVLLMQLPRKVETANALVDLWAARMGVDRPLVRSELEPPRWTLGPRRLELAWRGDGTTRGPLLLRVLAMTRRLIQSSVVAAAPNVAELLRRHADGFGLVGGGVWLRDADAADAVALLRRSLPRRADPPSTPAMRCGRRRLTLLHAESRIQATTGAAALLTRTRSSRTTTRANRPRVLRPGLAHRSRRTGNSHCHSRHEHHESPTSNFSHGCSALAFVPGCKDPSI